MLKRMLLVGLVSLGLALGTQVSAQTVVMGNDDCPITNPQGVTICGGKLYAVSGQTGTFGRIRAKDETTGACTTVVTGYNLPTGITCLGGLVYFTESAESASKIHRINADGTVTLIRQEAFGAAPRGIAVQGTSLVWANMGNNSLDANRVRLRVGTSTFTLAGNGTASSSGDGGAALNASLWNPYGVAVTTDGVVHESEFSSNRVRKIIPGAPTQTIQAEAGTGFAGFTGDGGPAVSARLNAPRMLAASGTDLYICDGIAFQPTGVRRVRAGVIDTVINLTPLGVCTGIHIDGSNAYVAVAAQNAVYRYSLSGVPTATPTQVVAPTTPAPTNTPPPTLSPSRSPTSLPPVEPTVICHCSGGDLICPAVCN